MAMYGKRPHRRRSVGSYRHTLPPWILILICFAVALILALIVGNVLKSCLDEDAYHRLVSPAEDEAPNDPIQTDVPDVQASAYALGESLDTVDWQAAVSVSINRADGSLTYHSPVSEQLGMIGTDACSLPEIMPPLLAQTSYVSGAFTPLALKQTSSDLRFAVTAQECALLREFVGLGGDDVVLIGLAVDADGMAQLRDYVAALRQAIGDTPIGIALSPDTVTAENGFATVSDLLAFVDFCLLDLRAETPDSTEAAVSRLSALSYYFTQYDLRLLLSADQSALISALDEGRDYQTVGHGT